MMTMKNLRIFLGLFLIFLLVAAEVLAQSDSIVTYQITLINKRTGKPVPGVKVHYKKLPYESEIGNLTSDNAGKVTAYFRAHEKYSLSIDNPGFLKVAEIVNPLEGASSDLVVNRTVNLIEGGVGTVLKLENLKFRRGEATIMDESYVELDRLVEMLQEAPNLRIRLEGHTDYVGNPTANLALSQQRVDAVKAYLVEKGIDAKRIETKAFGGSQPLVKSTNAAERAVNRRVEVRIIGDTNE
ncbi:MAG TPA: OmpA family protein [Flammeovirgaceae bacterium]|nr:OmpA family protein [Flammeovirgaceae bacterium]